MEITPAAGEHAIEVMAFAVEFGGSLNADDIKRIADIYESSAELKAWLPNKKNMQQLNFSINADQNGSTPAIHTDPLGGLEFSSIPNEAGKIAWTVAVLRDFMTCQCLAYDDWDKVKPKALSVIQPILGCLTGPSREIKALGLQYQDAFVISGEDFRNFRINLVAQQPNKLLPESIFQHPSFWHVHQGWFAAAANNRRVLNLLNVDLNEEPDNYRLRINGQHRMLNVDMQGQSLSHNNSDLECDFDHMHDVNKELLINLLNDEMLRRIKLHAPVRN